jgi:hypothetical protein
MAAIVAVVGSDDANGDCRVYHVTFIINDCSLQRHPTIFGSRPAQHPFDLSSDWTAGYQR